MPVGCEPMEADACWIRNDGGGYLLDVNRREMKDAFNPRMMLIVFARALAGMR